MADFISSYLVTKRNEGVWDNNPNDSGGETCFGISRNNFPQWGGWAIVDHMATIYVKGTPGFIKAAESDSHLAAQVRTWYKENFWDIFDLGKVPNQSLATEIFDQAVNVGVSQTTKFIQRSYNSLNHDYKFGADLLVDGKCGPQTKAAVVTLGNNEEYCDVFRKALDCLQGAFYVELGLKDNSYRTFTKGWLRNRIGIMD
jgi:lysozyme family protein